jgi:hypothetical protein
VQYRKLQDLICFGMVPLFAAASYGALPLYGYLLNPRVAWLLLLPTVLLSIGYFMYTTVGVPYTFTISIGKPDIASSSNARALFVVIPVTTVLVLYFGLVGAACSWIVYHLFLYSYMIPRICREGLEVPAWTWYRHLSRVALLVALTYGVAWIVVVVPLGYSTASLVAGYILASLAFTGGAYLLMGPELRGTIRLLPRRLLLRGVGGAS